MHPHTTSPPSQPGSTPDAVIGGVGDGVEALGDALDGLLRQIVGGYFVLTDGQGAVSKWSEPAELLFGRPAEQVLGQGFFATLVAGPLPHGGAAWRHFLDAGEPPGVPGRVEVVGLHADGSEIPLEAVFVPVKLDEGFDFSLFLEDLAFELPLNLMLMRMRQQHPVVVRALRSALEDEPQPWEGWRTAGTLVIFRPLGPTPWVDAELAAREAARAEADAEAEERLTNPDPGIQGNSIADLDDAAAVVARLLGALERIDDLERVAEGLPAQLEDARREAQASRGRAEAAEREAQMLRSELQRAVADLQRPAEDPQRAELLTRLERLERARLDGDEAEAARRRTLAAAESARAQLSARLDQLDPPPKDRAFLVQEFVADGIEIFAGVSRDPDFGLSLAFGMGGTAIETTRDFALRMLPLREGDAEAMIGETRGAAMLGAVRGRPAADVKSIVACLEALADFAQANADGLDEVDLNPIKALPQARGCVVVDALIVARIPASADASARS
jgi:hypothetical protein